MAQLSNLAVIPPDTVNRGVAPVQAGTPSDPSTPPDAGPINAAPDAVPLQASGDTQQPDHPSDVYANAIAANDPAPLEQ
jgi:hypothetical protein